MIRYLSSRSNVKQASLDVMNFTSEQGIQNPYSLIIEQNVLVSGEPVQEGV